MCQIQHQNLKNCQIIDIKLKSISRIEATLILLNKVDVNLVSQERITSYTDYIFDVHKLNHKTTTISANDIDLTA